MPESTRPHNLGAGKRGRRATTALTLLTLLVPQVVVTQDVTAPALKAAFIYNFVKFTEWPARAPVSDPFVMCVTGDAAVGEALERLVEGREFGGRRLVVVHAATSRPKGKCDVVYVSGGSSGDAIQVVAGLQDSPVLTISDVAGFTDTGGMAQFFIERGRLRFHINVSAVQRSGLKMSSKLLDLAPR